MLSNIFKILEIDPSNLQAFSSGLIDDLMDEHGYILYLGITKPCQMIPGNLQITSGPVAVRFDVKLCWPISV